MICEVYDDKFDPLYLHYLFENTISQLPYNFTNIANRDTYPYGFSGSHRLVGCTVFSRDGLNRITKMEQRGYNELYKMYEIIENKILGRKFYLSNIGVNLQTKDMDGTCHADAAEGEDDEYTILVMSNPVWKKEWGPASFQLLEKYDNDSKVIEDHEYVPGRVLVIPSPHPHRGLAPIERYVYRTSIVFRVTSNFEKHIPSPHSRRGFSSIKSHVYY